MGDPVGLDSVLQRLGNRILPDDIIERLRAIFSC